MVNHLIHLPSGSLKCVFLANISTINKADVMMNSGTPVNIEIGLLTKIRKNTIPFQAKANARKAFIQPSVLEPGWVNTR